MTDLAQYAHQVAVQARDASAKLAIATRGRKDEWLRHSAELIRRRQS